MRTPCKFQSAFVSISPLVPPDSYYTRVETTRVQPCHAQVLSANPRHLRAPGAEGSPGVKSLEVLCLCEHFPVLCAHELISAFLASMLLQLPKPGSGPQMCSLWLTWCFKNLLSQHLRFGLFHLKHLVSSFSGKAGRTGHSEPAFSSPVAGLSRVAAALQTGPRTLPVHAAPVCEGARGSFSSAAGPCCLQAWDRPFG